MSRKLQKVKYRSKGCSHSDGTEMMCVRCSIEARLEARARRNRAVYQCEWKAPTGTVLPVGYCETHVPEEVKDRVS